MANPIATDQATVLQAVVSRLIDQIADLGFTTSTCFVSPEPEILLPNSGHNFLCTVCALDSRFNDSAMTGGAEAVCIEEGGIVVTPHTAMKLDRVERLDKTLTDATRGLLTLKKRIIKSLTGHRLSSGGNELMVNLPHPLNAARTRWNPATSFAFLSVTFSTDWLWNLS